MANEKFRQLAQQGIFYQSLGGEQKPAEEDGDFMRGVKKSMYQIPQTVGGAVALAGDLVGSEGMRDYGMGVYQKNDEKIQAITKPSDSLSTVLEGDGNAADWLQNAAGYTAGQAATALATGGVGGFIGKQLALRGIKSVTERAIESAAAREVANKVASQGIKYGAGAALGGNNLVQEAGSIYPEAVRQAQEEGRELDAGDKARVVGSALAAAAVDTGMDALMAGRVLNGSRRALTDQAGNIVRNEAGQAVMEGFGKAARREVLGAMGREGVTEGIQTGIERYGAGQDLSTADAIRDYVDSIGVGMVGGGQGGAMAALHAQKVPDAGPLSRAANAGIDNQIMQLQYDPQPLISFPDGSVGHKQDLEAYLTQFPEGEERTRKRREIMGRDPETGKRIQPEPEPEPLMANSPEAEKRMLGAWADSHEAVPLDYAQALLSSPAMEQFKDKKLMIVPHPSGHGYTVVPARWLTPDTQAKSMLLQKKGDKAMLPAPDREAPGGAIRVDGSGEAAPETYADQARTAQMARDEAEADALIAARERDLGKSVPHGPKPAATAKGPIPTLNDVILNPKGEPFKSEFAAKRKLAADGLAETHVIQPADGGFVLAPKAEQQDDSDIPTLTAMLDSGDPTIPVLNDRLNNGDPKIPTLTDRLDDGDPSAPVLTDIIKPEPKGSKDAIQANPEAGSGEQPADVANAEPGATVAAGEPGIAGAVPDVDAAAGAPALTEQGAEATQSFAPESGTLGIPREEMPQVRTEAHGGLVRHLNAQGIEHETKMVSPGDLKPTQAEFIPERVEAAKEATGDRAVIVANDGHIIDGHHQVLAAQEQGRDVKAIVLDAPIDQALEAVRNSPSAAAPTVGESGAAVAESGTTPAAPEPLKFRDAQYRRKADGWEVSRDGERWGEVRSKQAREALDRGEDPNPEGATVARPAKPKALQERARKVAERTAVKDVDSTAQGMLTTAREHKAAAWAKVKDLRAKIKDNPLGNSHLRLELLKAEDRHKEYQRMERSALEKIEQDAQEQGKTTAKPLDHGELNIPGRTNNIDAELDKHKTTKAAEAKTATKARAAQTRADKIRAKELHAEHAAAMLDKYGPKFDRKELAKEFDSMVKWEPAKFIKLAEKFASEQAATKDVREAIEHKGTKIYPIMFKDEPHWSVQTLENKGTDRVFGDTIHTDLDAAKKQAERDIAELASRAEYESEQQREADEREAKKAANRGKSVVERRADSLLDKPTKLPREAGLGVGTRREAMEKAVEQERAIVEKMIEDTAARKRDKDAMDRMSRAGYLIDHSNPNIPLVKAAREARDRLKDSNYLKPEYRVYSGQTADGSFFEITKTEYEYAKALTNAAKNGDLRASTYYADKTIDVDGERKPIMDSRGDLIAPDFAGQLAFWKNFDGKVDEKGRPILDDDTRATMGINGSEVDSAVAGMVREGASTDDILAHIADKSSNPDFRALAASLRAQNLKTGIVYGRPNGTYAGGVEASQATASYRQATDTAYLHQTPGAEQNVLHELTHAATLRALQRGGLAATQIKALYESVKARPNFAGEYGITDAEEFVAEAFTSPRFRQMLADTPAPGVKLSLWQKLVGAVRILLGRAAVTDSVLERVMQAAPGLMAENRGDVAPAGEAKPVDSMRAMVSTATEAFRRWFGDSKVVDAQGKPLVMYHGSATTGIEQFLPHGFGKGEVQKVLDQFRKAKENNERYGYMNFRGGSFFSPKPDYAGNYTGENGGVMYPVYIKAENPVYVDMVTRKAHGIDASKTPDALIMHINGDIQEIAIMDPVQVKSATGNNGNFDPNNPDLRASTATADSVTSFMGRLGVNKTLSQRVGDLFSSEKTLNSWWHKTVGTQYHKAQVDKDFGRVYNAVQRYLSSVSALANESADLAPTMLPKLDGLSDLKKAPPKREDVKAAATAIFQGTLVDEQVYSDAELQSKFALTAPQIKLYREFRAATDKSLDDMGKTDLIRTAGKQYAGMRDAVLGARDVGKAAEMLAAEAESRGDEGLAGSLREKGDRYAELKENGYAPLMRFGEHTVYVTDANGEQLYFGLYESAPDAAKAARDMREIYPDATVTKGIMSTEGSRLFAGISPDTIELFSKVAGIDQDPLFQDYLKLVVNNRSALKRLIHRKGIAGYSEDATRVLASFLTSNARAAAKNLHGGEMNEAAEAIPKNKGDVRDEAIKLVDYIQNPVDEASKVRGLLFANFIGGSIASAMVNMTQPVMMTLPYLSQYGGAGKAVKNLTAAMAQAVRPDSSIQDEELRTALQVAEHQGVVSPQEIHNLQAEASRSSTGLQIAGKEIIPPFAARKLALVWGGFFGLAEQFNRKATFIAAYQTARDMTGEQLERAGVSTPYEFAAKAIAETQGVYNRGNRANWGRGAVGATLMTFKQYSTSYLEFLKRLPPQQRAMALAILVVAAGANGLPFADDLDDLIDTIAQALGYNWQFKKARDRFLVNTLGHGAADFIQHGISGISGIPLDVSMRMGMQNLLPATGIFLKQNTDKSTQVAEIAGAAGALAQRVFKAGDLALHGEVGAAAGALSPTAIGNLAKGIDIMQTGYYRDGRGRNVMAADSTDALVKAIGFQPREVARQQEKLGDIRDQIAVANAAKTEFADDWAQGVYDKNPEAVAKARERIADWNRKNPETPVSINAAQIAKRVRAMRTEKADRVVKSAPKAARAALREELKD